MVTLITGLPHSGKSTCFLQRYQEAGVTDTALFSRKRLNASGSVEGYDLLLLPEVRMRPLTRLSAEAELFSEGDRLFQGRFVFSISALEWGGAYVLTHPTSGVWIDEVGKLELRGLGYADLLHEVLYRHRDVTLTIGSRYVSDFLSYYSVMQYQVIDLTHTL